MVEARWILAAVLGTSLSACSAIEAPIATDEDAINGGVRDEQHEAVVLVGAEADSWCSGVLIASDLVLTAAHCVAMKPITRIYVGTGQPRKPSAPFDPSGRRAFVVRATLAHPAFWLPPSVPVDLPDLALLRLETPADVPPIPLARALPAVGDASCVTVGFGLAVELGRPFSDHEGLQERIGERKRAAVVIHGATPRLLETKSGDGNASRGDSGGALLCGGELVGITHASGFMSVYFDRVDEGQAEHRAWIRAMSAANADWTDIPLRADGCPQRPGGAPCSAARTCEYGAPRTETTSCIYGARATCEAAGAEWTVTPTQVCDP